MLSATPEPFVVIQSTPSLTGLIKGSDIRGSVQEEQVYTQLGGSSSPFGTKNSLQVVLLPFSEDCQEDEEEEEGMKREGRELAVFKKAIICQCQQQELLSTNQIKKETKQVEC